MPRLPLIVLGSLLLAPALALAGVTITVLDVGQGDATLVESSSGATLLFDGGPNGTGSSIILPYLTSRGIESLDYIVASHYHADHIGGLDEVYSRTGATSGVWEGARGLEWTLSSPPPYHSFNEPPVIDETTVAHAETH